MTKNEPKGEPRITGRIPLDIQDILPDESPLDVGYESAETLLDTYRRHYEMSLREILHHLDLVFQWTTGPDGETGNTCTCREFGQEIPCRHELSLEGTDERAHQRALQMTLPPANTGQQRQVHPQ